METKTARIKKQHYVPRFLLSEFSIPANSGRPQIWCFDKREVRAFRVAVDKVCAERAFYDLDNDQGAEHAFADMEGKLSQCLRAAIENRNILLLSDHERVGIGVLIATQCLRTRSFRNTIKEAGVVFNAIKNDLSIDINTLSNEPNLDLSHEETAKRFQFQILGRAISTFTKSLLRMHWVLHINETKSKFWLSDNPFTVFNPFPYDPNDDMGFERIGSQTHFPLSPDLNLSIVDPRCYNHYQAIVTVNDVQNIIFNNSLQLKNAERYIFSCSNDFALAIKMISKNPGLKNSSQGRFRHLNLERFRR